MIVLLSLFGPLGAVASCANILPVSFLKNDRLESHTTSDFERAYFMKDMRTPSLLYVPDGSVVTENISQRGYFSLRLAISVLLSCMG